MHALEIGDFGLIASLDERVEARLDERADAATEDGLLAEQVGLGLFGEGGFDYAGAGAANAAGVRKRKLLGFAGGILLDGQQARRAAAFDEDFADAVARRFRSNHGHIHKWRRDNLSKMNVEAVREHQRLPGAKMRFDGSLVDSLLCFVRQKNHDHVGNFRRLLDRHHGKPVFFCAHRRGTAGVSCHADIHAAVAHVERMRMSLAAVSDNCDFLGFDQAGVAVLFIIDVGHEVSLSVTSTEMTSICL